jgi:hypothetical protein
LAKSNEPLIRLRMESKHGDTAYVELPGHPNHIVPGCIARSVDLDGLLDYEGPKIYLDLDSSDRLIGIEILIFGVRD